MNLRTSHWVLQIEGALKTRTIRMIRMLLIQLASAEKIRKTAPNRCWKKSSKAEEATRGCCCRCCRRRRCIGSGIAKRTSETASVGVCDAGHTSDGSSDAGPRRRCNSVRTARAPSTGPAGLGGQPRRRPLPPLPWSHDESLSPKTKTTALRWRKRRTVLP
jgi:hypothetical protein